MVFERGIFDFCSYPPAHLVDFCATESAEKRVKSTDFDCKFCGFVSYWAFWL